MAKNRFPTAVKIVEYEFKSENVVIGQQEIIQYEDFGRHKIIKQPITDYKYFVSGTVVGLMRPQNAITRSRSRSKNKN